MNPFTAQCFCCNRKFKFGQGAYHGRRVLGYDMMVCSNCYDANWDGWAPLYTGKILNHLQEKGLEPPTRNSSGWLPRDWPPSAAEA